MGCPNFNSQGYLSVSLCSVIAWEYLGDVREQGSTEDQCGVLGMETAWCLTNFDGYCARAE